MRIATVITSCVWIIEPITQQSLQVHFHDRFRYEIIKSTHFRCDLFLISVMCCAGYNIRYIRLRYLHLLEEHLQRFHHLVSCHNRHFYIHEDDLIFFTFIAYFLITLDIPIAYLLICLLSIERLVHRSRGKPLMNATK